ncbi:MAG TPA: glycosyl hydrolase family 43, partial [Candidatus Brocadiia bacterium]|nr:glycosyl hydrolase family 43 [Candidatus Brocadiia bacterium]
DGPDAPFRRLGNGPVPPFNGFFGNAPIEDVFLWRADGRFQLLAKDLTPNGALAGETHGGVHATSADGLRWEVSGPSVGYSRRVRWSDGSVTTQGCMERPFLLIEDGRPTHLFAATGDGPGGFNHCARTWNMAVPI